MTWIVNEKDESLIKQIKIYEGTKEYQESRKYFKNGKFYTYSDSLGFPTIGYGHLILKGEDFSNGLTEAEADELLSKDLKRTIADAKSVYDKYNMDAPYEVQKVLVQMVFQLGVTKTNTFTNTLKYMANKDYKKSASNMRQSLWYKQTPNRVEELAKVLESI